MNDLETEVLKIIGENTDTPDVFTDDTTGMAQIRDSVNQGVQMLCMLTGSYQKTYYLPLREDCQFYRLQWERDHFGYVVQAWDRQRQYRLVQTSLGQLTYDDPRWMERVGPAERYFHLGYNVIGIYMKPADSDRVLDLDCVVIPETYTTDTDPVKLREAFERAVIQYAVSEFFASRGNAERANEWFRRGLETAGLKKIHPLYAEQIHQMGGYRPNRMT